jgi:hypothetical protein
MSAVDIKEIQKAVFTALNVSSLRTAIGGTSADPKIYDRVPTLKTPVFPYVTFGTPVYTAMHSQTSAIQEVLFQVDVWHRDTASNTGKGKVYDIQKIVTTLLDRQRLTISGAINLYTQARTVTILDGNDGQSWHGVQVFAIGASPSS